MADEFNPHLQILIAQYMQIGMVGLGKMPNPVDGESKLELTSVQFAIETLQMLEKKTRGNLTPAEAQELGRVLTLLRLNYVDAAEKASQPSSDEAPTSETESAAPAADASSEASSSTGAEASTADPKRQEEGADS